MKIQEIAQKKYAGLITLLVIALVIGIYHIATTVLIAKDGVYYIEFAKSFYGGFSRAIEDNRFGYPLLIFLVHKLLNVFSSWNSNISWIISAQTTTLICRVLAIVLLYFIGKKIIGAEKTFIAILVLIFLPEAAKIGTDTLRDWPYIFSLSLSLLFLLYGIERGKIIFFGLTGLICGLSFFIRPEVAQIALYGGLWGIANIIWHKFDMSRLRTATALCVMSICFILPLGFYAYHSGKVIPDKVKALVAERSTGNDNYIIDDKSNTLLKAGIFDNKIFSAINKLVERLGKHLMWYFVPILGLGIYSRIKQNQLHRLEKLFYPAFLILNLLMLIALYLHYGYISSRHCLSIIVFTIFFIPAGIESISKLFADKFRWPKVQTTQTILLIGLGICASRLWEPIRMDKQYYRQASNWLRENTKENDIIFSAEPRIYFYAERQGVLNIYGHIPTECKYAIRFNENDKEIEFDRPVKLLTQIKSKSSKSKKIDIFEVF